jgi:gamma-glutamyl hydrolase
LTSFFDILALAHNDENDMFLAVIEAKNYPIYGSQFHPEKSNYEWRVPANHGLNSITGS